MAKRKYYCIKGRFEQGGNQKMSLEKRFTSEERHLQAFSIRQARFLFARRFSGEIGRKVYIGEADVFEVDPPGKNGRTKKFKKEEKGKTEEKRPEQYKQEKLFKIEKPYSW